MLESFANYLLCSLLAEYEGRSEMKTYRDCLRQRLIFCVAVQRGQKVSASSGFFLSKANNAAAYHFERGCRRREDQGSACLSIPLVRSTKAF